MLTALFINYHERLGFSSLYKKILSCATILTNLTYYFVAFGVYKISLTYASFMLFICSFIQRSFS